MARSASAWLVGVRLPADARHAALGSPRRRRWQLDRYVEDLRRVEAQRRSFEAANGRLLQKDSGPDLRSELLRRRDRGPRRRRRGSPGISRSRTPSSPSIESCRGSRAGGRPATSQRSEELQTVLGAEVQTCAAARAPLGFDSEDPAAISVPSRQRTRGAHSGAAAAIVAARRLDQPPGRR
jgi:hypothetical protein